MENAFGILSSKWQIYQRMILFDVVKATKVVKATCVLHNFWRSNLPWDPHREGDDTLDHGQAFQPLTRTGNNPALQLLPSEKPLMTSSIYKSGSCTTKEILCKEV